MKCANCQGAVLNRALQFCTRCHNRLPLAARESISKSVKMVGITSSEAARESLRLAILGAIRALDTGAR